jgi:cardiolipin synthase
MAQNILVGSTTFMNALRESALKATERFYVQAMTFEGDAAGEQLIGIMLKCPAADRCLIIDSYSKVVVNDRFVFSPGAMMSAEFNVEIRNGKSLLKKAADAGIEVVFTNPTGPFLARYPFRNHKKMVVADDTVYVGGINFSDHNFEWQDMMVRFDDVDMAGIMSADFNSNRVGQKTSGVYEHQHGHILFTNRTQSEPYQVLFDYLRRARNQIDIFSPYVSSPLLEILKKEVNSDVNIRFYTPKSNNKGIFKKMLHHHARERWFDLQIYQDGMSHLKAILIDESILITGSSNYDFVSYFFEEEVMVTTRQDEIITEFRTLVGDHYQEHSVPYDSSETDQISNRIENRLSAFVLNSAYNILKSFFKP